MENFTHEVAERLKFYVYRLIDPRNGETFYVGKGNSRPGRSYDNTHTREQGFFLNFVQLFFRLADGKDKAGSAASQIRHTAGGLVRKAINRLNVVDPRG